MLWKIKTSFIQEKSVFIQEKSVFIQEKSVFIQEKKVIANALSSRGEFFYLRRSKTCHLIPIGDSVFSKKNSKGFFYKKKT